MYVENDEINQWVDTFAWGDLGYIYWTSNRLQKYLTSTLDFSGVN